MKQINIEDFFETKYCKEILNQIHFTAKNFSLKKQHYFNHRNKNDIYKNTFKGLLIEEINKFILQKYNLSYFCDIFANHSRYNSDMFDLMTINGKTIDVKSWSPKNQNDCTKNLDYEWTKKRRVDYYVVYDLPAFKKLKTFHYLELKHTLELINFYGFISFKSFENQLSFYPEQGFVKPKSIGRHQNYFYVLPDKAPNKKLNVVNNNFDDYLNLFKPEKPFYSKQSKIKSKINKNEQSSCITVTTKTITKKINERWTKLHYHRLGDIHFVYQQAGDKVISYQDKDNFDWQIFTTILLKTVLKNTNKQVIVHLPKSLQHKKQFKVVYELTKYMNIQFIFDK